MFGKNASNSNDRHPRATTHESVLSETVPIGRINPTTLNRSEGPKVLITGTG